MTLEELHKELSFVNASRENRLKNAKMVLNDLSLLPKLISILFSVDNKVSCKAGWILEYVCAENINVIIPYLDEFTASMNKIHLDSAVRPVAKICEFLAKSNDSKEQNHIKDKLSTTHKERIIACCFDWMINDEKVAVKAYAMSTLFLLGKETPWVHNELAQILEQDYPHQSAAFKARARHILKKMKKANL